MFEFGFRKGTKKTRGLLTESTWDMCKVLIKSLLLPPPITQREVPVISLWIRLLRINDLKLRKSNKNDFIKIY